MTAVTPPPPTTPPDVTPAVTPDVTPDAGATTSLERQQLLVTAPAGETFWHRVRFELVGRIADEIRASRVVDIGAGSGLLGEWLATNQSVVEYRFEETSPALDAALERRFGESRRNDPDARISSSALVALLDVIEHIEDDAAALRALARRIDPGAHVVITVPALQWAFSSWDTALGHFRRYSRSSLTDVVGGAGLTVLRCDYLFPELLPLLPVRTLRRGARADVDVPRLPAAVARVGYRISSATTAARRIWPAGTSLALVARRDRSG
jgi:SAM-dependent methyltransferase